MSKKIVNVTMRVRVGQNEIEITGPSNYVEKKIAEFLEKQNSSSVATEREFNESSQPTGSIKKSSVSQFFRKIALKSETDRVLAAGYFLETFKKSESFTSAEIRETIREAKIQPPKNTNDSINKNIKKGYMMTAGDKDGKMAFVLTTDGEEVISNLFKE